MRFTRTASACAPPRRLWRERPDGAGEVERADEARARTRSRARRALRRIGPLSLRQTLAEIEKHRLRGPGGLIAESAVADPRPVHERSEASARPRKRPRD